MKMFNDNHERGTLLVLIVALCLAMLSGRCSADEWTKYNTRLEMGYVALALADAMQTNDIQNHDDIEEANPVARALIGNNPSTAGTAAYFGGAIVGHYVISRVLPKGWREAWQTGTVIVQGGVVANNWAIGLKVGF